MVVVDTFAVVLATSSVHPRTKVYDRTRPPEGNRDEWLDREDTAERIADVHDKAFSRTKSRW